MPHIRIHTAQHSPAGIVPPAPQNGGRGLPGGVLVAQGVVGSYEAQHYKLAECLIK